MTFQLPLMRVATFERAELLFVLLRAVAGGCAGPRLNSIVDLSDGWAAENPDGWT